MKKSNKIMFISIVSLLFFNCKSTLELNNIKPHSTDDVVDEQNQDYEESMKMNYY